MKIEQRNNMVRRCPFAQNDGINLTNYTTGRVTRDKLHEQSKAISCQEKYCYGSLMAGQSGILPAYEERSKGEVFQQASEFLENFYLQQKKIKNDEYENRMKQVKESIELTGTYDLTGDELLFGAKLAWRNAPRCIGRIQWNKLKLQDARHVKTTKEMYEILCQHLTNATNGGNIRSVISVFPRRQPGRKDFRVWNPQLLSFAGYLQPDGSVIGDPGHVQFTRVCQRLGWKGHGGKFDILPWVFSTPNEGPQFYEIPEELVLRIHLEHPKYTWFRDLGLQWYAVPAVADMLLDVGGIQFPACPFNGWYMGTEVGARDLCDAQRYNVTEMVASKLGIDMSTPSTLWKDQALLEVNVAVLYSFQKQNVTIVDHHTASETFLKHYETEQKQRGGCPADWVWIVPPISGSLTSVFHQEMLSYNLKPSYEYQVKAWKSYKWEKNANVQLKYKFASIAKAIFWTTILMKRAKSDRETATILYATETGKSETFSNRLQQILSNTLNVRVVCMEDYNLEDISNESILIVITSTFGNGEAPDNGKVFWKDLTQFKNSHQRQLNQLKFTVFALGSTQYPTFCAFGKNIDNVLGELGCQRILPIGLGDELRGQEQTFNKWIEDLYKVMCNLLSIEVDDSYSFASEVSVWHPQNYKVTVMPQENPHEPWKELSRLHSKTVLPYKVLSKANLQARYSTRQTILVRLNPSRENSLSYLPGDHLGVFASNSSVLVDGVISKIHMSGRNVDDILKIESYNGKNWTVYSRLPVCSLKTALTKYLDLTTPPSAHFLLLMSGLATEKWDAYRLKRLANDIDEYEEWRSFQYPNMAEVLEEFSSVIISPEFLLTQLPLLQPRYYSISSSPLAHPTEILLTVAVVNFRCQGGKGKLHHGVCSNYLNDFPEEDVHVFVRSAPSFHLPENSESPVIMIGAGSGIAPFRSFWIQRDIESKQKKIGEMLLFFGCRQRKVDLIYEHETSPLVRKGTLSRVVTAFSREQGQKKKYVQHSVGEESELVYNLIESQRGHIYVCGDATMCDDVRKAVKDIIKVQSNCTVEKADERFLDLQNEGRYHEDVFGITHRKL